MLQYEWPRDSCKEWKHDKQNYSETLIIIDSYSKIT